MKFPWVKYEELPVERRNTLQVFITNRCNLKCKGCFARKVMGNRDQDMPLSEYQEVIEKFLEKGGRQINLLGGEPLLHPQILDMCKMNMISGIKTTIYTNGTYLNQFVCNAFSKYLTKIRLSIYGPNHYGKGLQNLDNVVCVFDTNFMVSRTTTLPDLLNVAREVDARGCEVFFISSLRELDNPRKEFFDDTDLTMPVLEYKELIHNFLWKYDGDMEIHVSKRGVFESSIGNPVGNKCIFANQIIGGKIIQCPYDLVNEKYQDDYTFGKRFCQHNTTCLMSKVVYRKRT